jgi:hypothetical protein
MSERNTLGSSHAENPVDLIKRTVNNHIVVISSFLEDGALKFKAQLVGGPTVILEHKDGVWSGDYADNELVAQLGEIIENASD